MTVKELKEMLEMLIMEGKEDYTVLVDYSIDEPIITVNDFFGEIFISSTDEE